MKVFDFEIPDSELSESISDIYKMPAVVMASTFEIAATEAPARLAKAVLTVQLGGSIKTLEVLVQECSPHTLAVVSVIEKLLPNSCPKIFGYRSLSDHAWLILENISTWLDTAGISRMNESALDGLFAIHSPFFGEQQLLLDSFKIFSVITKGQLSKHISFMMSEIDRLVTENHSAVINALADWSDVKTHISEVIIKSLDFPTTLLHGSYTPNNIRSISYPNEVSLIIAYDWRYARIGWPQLDLAILLDRLDMLAESKRTKGPSEALLERYWLCLRTSFDDNISVDFNQFLDVYKFSYICQALPLIRLWATRLSVDPKRDPLRATAEISLKCNTILGKDARVFIDK